MTDEFDLIVVGGGGSGLACAVAAAEKGASVLVLEKQATLGGTTGIAIGSFTANRTKWQQQAGIVDNPDDHELDAAKFGPPQCQALNNRPLRRFFLGEASETLNWLSNLGLVFHGPSPEPPNRVPRMHNVIPNAKAYIAAFQLRLLQLGGSILCGAAVEELLCVEDHVQGVTALIAGGRREFRARRGVVLAAGDYANSPEMIARFKGPQFAAIEGINPHATGDGHRLAERAGAQMVNMEITYGPELRFLPRRENGFEQLLPTHGFGLQVLGRLLPWVPQWALRRLIKRLLVTWQHPEDSLFSEGAILVNSLGRRFCNELDSPARETAVAAQPDKRAYILLDERLTQHFSAWPHFVSTAPEIAYAYVADYLRLRPDVAIAADSLDDIAHLRSLPVSALKQSVTDFNACASGSHVDPFGRPGIKQTLTGPRWVLFGPVKAYFTTTEGGAAINEQMQVLDENNRPLRGLYAVGQNGLGGMVLWGHGLHIAWALTSGRLVGQSLGRQSSP